MFLADIVKMKTQISQNHFFALSAESSAYSARKKRLDCCKDFFLTQRDTENARRFTEKSLRGWKLFSVFILVNL